MYPSSHHQALEEGVPTTRMSGGLQRSNDSIELLIKSDEALVKDISPPTVSVFLKLFSACLYGVVSFLVIVINKIVLTTYKFPGVQVLGIGQMVTAIVLLRTLKLLGFITFPEFSSSIPRKIFPLPLLYVGNLVCGLGGTQRLSLPMFTALRRFSILLTMILEYIILNVYQSSAIILAVLAMVGGAVIAACRDLAFDARGYSFVLLNDVFTASNIVYVKKKLESKDLGKYGLLFYNAMFMIFPLFFISWATGDLAKAYAYQGWLDIQFLIYFLGACIMGFAVMYATVLCTQYNSALTTTIVGCLKNIMVTYVGMYVGGDYIFSITNFIGLNISMCGSLVYSYLTFIQTEKKRPHLPQSNVK